ncbi:MAG TPA: DUF6600 domain-containing protein, partial [Bryobacteraceae bacterium]|nr:DUF6600 domain-containing protein [Bryobacteraceae bacterium]
VSVRRGDSGDWVAAALNAPLVVDDSLLTGSRSRAELQFDWANMIRLSSETEVRLAELENSRYLVQVARGVVTFRVERDSDAEVEISTPSVSVRPVKKGSYRILVREDGESEITVRSGEAEVYTPQGSERLRPGRTMLARGSASNPEFQVVSAVGKDDWDRWNEERDRYFSRSNSYRYVDRSIYGAEDLDGYGTWIYDAPYGWVWSPRVAVGWSPYYYGRWSWIDWYGWSWISYDPWGWAPYHYGRWYHRANYGWCWYPGGMHRRHHWSPGLVAFIGWGGGGIGLGFGRVGWIPLAPNEPYYPWYGHGYYRGYRNSTYIDNSVHIVNNTNIVNVYRNARVNNAIVGVNGSEFGRGGGHVRVGAGEVGRAGLVRGQLPVVPDRNSLRLSDRPNAAAPPARVASTESFFSRRQPAQVERVPFEEQRRGMEQVSRRTFGEPATRSAEGAGSGRGMGSPRAEVPASGRGTGAPAPAGTGGENSGWRRVGEAPRTGIQDRGSTPEWRRFGGAAERTAPRSAEAPSARPAPSAARPSAPSDNGGWRRFEPSGESGRSAPAGSAPGRLERSAPSRQTESPRSSEGRRSEPLRISPPIVRERETPRMESPRVESPRAESPRMAAPRMEPPRMPAPRSEAPRTSAPSGGDRPSGMGRVSPGGSGGGGARAEGGGGRVSPGGGGRVQGRAR